MTSDLKHLLDVAADPVAERDFVDAAWLGARLRRRRSHLAVLGAVAAAAVVAAMVVLPGGDGAGRGLPAAPATTSFDMIGVRAVVGPQPDQVGRLPEVDDTTRTRIQLPRELGVLDEAEVGQPDVVLQPPYTDPVRAVLLRYTGPGVVKPVLYRPGSALPLVELDGMSLKLLTDKGGNVSEPLGIRAINDDRRRIVFAQPGKVLLFDAQTGDTRTFPVGDDHLSDAGWAADGAMIIARSEAGGWRIDATTGRVERLSEAAYPGASQFFVDDSGMRLLRFASTGTDGVAREAPPVFSETWGETVTSPAGWVASGGFLTDLAQGSAPPMSSSAYQGLFIIQGDRMANPRLLLAPGGSDAGSLIKGCCSALGWVSSDRLLVRWGSDILLWNVVSGEIARVSKAPSQVYRSDDLPAAGSLGFSFALAP